LNLSKTRGIAISPSLSIQGARTTVKRTEMTHTHPMMTLKISSWALSPIKAETDAMVRAIRDGTSIKPNNLVELKLRGVIFSELKLI
jgi:hypothetical protein